MLYLVLIGAAAGGALGAALGGRLVNLQHLPLFALWLAPVPLLLQAALFGTALGDQLGSLLGPAHLATYALLLVVLGLNWELTGFRVVAAGLVLNAVVIAANGGLMPVSLDVLPPSEARAALTSADAGGRWGKSIAMTEATRLPFLADWLPLTPLPAIVSPGDLLVGLGAAVLLVEGMRKRGG